MTIWHEPCLVGVVGWWHENCVIAMLRNPYHTRAGGWEVAEKGGEGAIYRHIFRRSDQLLSNTKQYRPRCRLNLEIGRYGVY